MKDDRFIDIQTWDEDNMSKETSGTNPLIMVLNNKHPCYQRLIQMEEPVKGMILKLLGGMALSGYATSKMETRKYIDAHSIEEYLNRFISNISLAMKECEIQKRLW